MNLTLAFLPTGGEWIWIGLIALVVFGPKKLPELARGLGRSLGEFKKAKEEFERELQSAANSPSTPAPQAPQATISQHPMQAPALLPQGSIPSQQAATAEPDVNGVPAPYTTVTANPTPTIVPQTKIS